MEWNGMLTKIPAALTPFTKFSYSRKITVLTKITINNTYNI